MASIFPIKVLTAAVLLLSVLSAADSISQMELEAMIRVLRARGYHLFANAIATSDLRFELLSGTSFTLFAPTDRSLFALDMTNNASDYLTILRFHVLPTRLSLPDLRRIPPTLPIQTLLSNSAVFIQSRCARNNYQIIAVDGVNVILPGLFYSRYFAVHGLRGLLRTPIRMPHPLRFPVQPPFDPPPLNHGRRNNRPRRGTHPPPSTITDSPPQVNFSGNHSFGLPVVVPVQTRPKSDLPHSEIFPPPVADRAHDHTVMLSPTVRDANGVPPAYCPPEAGDVLPRTPPAQGIPPATPLPPRIKPRPLSSPGQMSQALPSLSSASEPSINASSTQITEAVMKKSERRKLWLVEEPEKKRGVAGKAPAMMQKKEVAGVTPTIPAKSKPSAEVSDCPVTGGPLRFRHVIISRDDHISTCARAS